MGLFSQLTESIPKINIDEKLSLEQIQSLLGDKFFGLLNQAYQDRQSDTENSGYSKADIQKVIQKYSNINMDISATSSFVPGPLGILTSAGEMVAIVGNNMKMIYDIGCANDKEDFLNKDLLLDIPLHAMGVNMNLDMLQNSPSDLMDSAEDVLMEKALEFGKISAEKMLKKSIVKFIPVGGSVIMAIWTKMMNNKIAHTTSDFFDSAKVLAPVATQKDNIDSKQLEIEKIKAFINLIEIDKSISDAEMQFILPVIKNAEIDEHQKETFLTQAGKTGSEYEVDFDLIKLSKEEAELFLMDLAVLAKRDGSVEKAEKEYFMKVGISLNFEEKILEELINEEATQSVLV